MGGNPLRFGLYFLDQKLQPGKGPVMKLVLCKVAVGNSMCRSEADAATLSRCPSGYESVYVPGNQSAGTSVFNDTYILYDSEFAVPTHVVSYHFDVAQLSSQDDELVHWVDWQCNQMLGFAEPSFTQFLISLAQNAESASSLRRGLRNQADVPASVADALAEALFAHVPRNSSSAAPRTITATREKTSTRCRSTRSK